MCELFSKRSAEIDDFVDDRSSYRARALAARSTRAAKSDQSPDLLAIRWQTELAEIGWAPDRFQRSIDAAGLEEPRPDGVPGSVPAGLPEDLVAQLTDEVLGPESRLGGLKVLSRRDLMVEVGPHLYGRPVELLEDVVDRILASSAVVPLVAVTAAREQVYAPTRTLAVEQAVADTMERLATSPAPRPIGAGLVAGAVATKESELGRPLTVGQRAAVEAIAAAGSRAQFVVGVAGAGKTTALDAAASALEAEQWRVLGTSTSGQAARTLGDEASIEARTVSSLLWRLDQGHERLDRNTVVVLDEAAMTTDDDLLQLVTAVEVTGARVVLAGDPVQLGAVGPGGAMAALMTRHPPLVTHLSDNVRQHDPDERRAVAHLRAGRVDQALDWYQANDRIHTAPSRPDSIEATVAAWNRDVEAGVATTMLAWRRDDVDALNHDARELAIATGRVHGPSLDSGGLEIAVGDNLVALEPNHRAGIVTSQRLTVTHVDAEREVVTMASGGRVVELQASELDRSRFGYGYATTIHRAQGATFDTCHLYADGGTHQLAYVALTRARHATSIHVVAESTGQAVEDFRAAWCRPDTQRWVVDDRPDHRHRDRNPGRVDANLENARLRAEHDSLCRLPTTLFDSTEQAALMTDRHELLRARNELRTGTGSWADTPAGRAVRRYAAATSAHAAAETRAGDPRLLGRDRRRARRHADQLVEAIERAVASWAWHGQPVDDHLAGMISAIEGELAASPTTAEQDDRALALERRLERVGAELGHDEPESYRRLNARSRDGDQGLRLGL